MWDVNEEKKLIKLYAENNSIKQISKILNKTENSIRNKLYRMNMRNKKFLTEKDIEYIKNNYKSYNLQEISSKLKRNKTYICKVAKKFGLDMSCKKKENIKTTRKYKNEEERKLAHSNMMKKWIKEKGHPKGMLGKKHSIEYCNEISNRVKEYWSNMSEEKLEKIIDKQINSKKKNGTLNSLMSSTNPYSRTKGYKRIDLNNKYFRSSWEANFARYLNYTNTKWEYEPKTFYFENIKRGCISYTPDFYLPETNEWVEIKGWMDSKSKTKLKRFAKYYPDEKLILIDNKKYRQLSKQFKDIIKNWESN